MVHVIRWAGYDFNLYGSNETFPSASGVYIFAGVNARGNWTAYYVGQTENFSDRLHWHEKWEEALRLGATHIHLYFEPTYSTRIDIEAAVIEATRPILNR